MVIYIVCDGIILVLYGLQFWINNELIQKENEERIITDNIATITDILDEFIWNTND